MWRRKSNDLKQRKRKNFLNKNFSSASENLNERHITLQNDTSKQLRSSSIDILKKKRDTSMRLNN